MSTTYFDSIFEDSNYGLDLDYNDYFLENEYDKYYDEFNYFLENELDNYNDYNYLNEIDIIKTDIEVNHRFIAELLNGAVLQRILNLFRSMR